MFNPGILSFPKSGFGRYYAAMSGTPLPALGSFLLGVFLSSCSVPRAMSPPPPALHATHYTSFDGDPFLYKHWLPREAEPEMVVVGFHGISGASDDYGNLGRHLRERRRPIAVYAPDLRGQGYDPDKQRRGDLRTTEEWFRDAHTFSSLVRARHPGARIIWCGESMGSLIALNAFNWQESPPCEALILSSPVVSIPPERLPGGKRFLFHTMANLNPTGRVALEDLFNERQTRLTHDTVHQEQVAHNPWHVPKYSWRLLRHLEGLVRAMPEQAGRVHDPVLILHGGKDVFAPSETVRPFPAAFPPQVPVEFHYYPGSHHLLFYDHEREQVLRDTERWLMRLAGK
jgi:alpha-beta hydrolase superfamily lysophospholipase